MGIRLVGQDDLRHFRHFAKLSPDGSVAAVVEVADGSPDPLDTTGSVYVEVTDLYPYDLRTVKANPLDVQTAATAATQGITAQEATSDQRSAVAAIQTALATGKQKIAPKGVVGG